MKKTYISTLVAGLLAMTAISAQAQIEYYDQPIYYGGVFSGNATATGGMSNQPAAGATNMVLTGAGGSWGIMLGAQVSDKFGWEVSGKQSSYSNAGSQKTTATTYQAMGTVSKFFNDEWRAMARVGFASNSMDTAQSTIVPVAPAVAPPFGVINTNGLAYGAAIEYKVDDFISLRLMYDVTQARIQTSATTTGDGTLVDVSGGITYRF